MRYYHNLITEKSWQELQNLRKRIDFILIGGWAVYLYTKALKSKDIDIIVDFDQLSLLSKYYSLSKNERLKKYSARKAEVQIDIYLPHYSKIGIPVEELIKHKISLQGFNTLRLEYLMGVKLYVFSQRQHSLKGRKDFADLLSLYQYSDEGITRFKELIRRYGLDKEWEIFAEQVKKTVEFPELNLNRYKFARLKRKILEK